MFAEVGILQYVVSFESERLLYQAIPENRQENQTSDTGCQPLELNNEWFIAQQSEGLPRPLSTFRTSISAHERGQIILT